MVSAGTAKMLSPAAAIARSRSSRVTRRSGSTTLMRNGSAGKRTVARTLVRRARGRPRGAAVASVAAGTLRPDLRGPEPAQAVTQAPGARHHVVLGEQLQLVVGRDARRGRDRAAQR